MTNQIKNHKTNRSVRYNILHCITTWHYYNPDQVESDFMSNTEYSNNEFEERFTLYVLRGTKRSCKRIKNPSSSFEISLIDQSAYVGRLGVGQGVPWL